jgi:hypothetical protein
MPVIFMESASLPYFHQNPSSSTSINKCNPQPPRSGTLLLSRNNQSQNSLLIDLLVRQGKGMRFFWLTICTGAGGGKVCSPTGWLYWCRGRKGVLSLCCPTGRLYRYRRRKGVRSCRLVVVVRVSSHEDWCTAGLQLSPTMWGIMWSRLVLRL